VTRLPCKAPAADAGRRYRPGPPWLEGRKLVSVAEENHACLFRLGIEKLGHHGQGDHGGFVHHDKVDGERIIRVVPKIDGVGTVTEQPMQSGS
jgi:hypothetical protein